MMAHGKHAAVERLVGFHRLMQPRGDARAVDTLLSGELLDQHILLVSKLRLCAIVARLFVGVTAQLANGKSPKRLLVGLDAWIEAESHRFAPCRRDGFVQCQADGFYSIGLA